MAIFGTIAEDIRPLSLIQLLTSILRKAVDGTRTPLFIDEVNSRVLIGTTTASTSNAGKLEIKSGDIRVVTAGKGLILSSRDGTKNYRIIMENDGTIAADQL